MCGIIGYIGRKEAFPFLMCGLEKLEYRGYDSAGIALCTDELQVQKAIGKLSEIHFNDVEGSLGIAHTRWATHGKVSKENAHLHLDCGKEIAIVHNGIIEDYKELKESLIEKGHVFTSETDSEVIVHLIEESISEGISFEDAFINALRMLKGRYTILALKTGEKKLVGTRKGSRSLSIGVSEHGFFPSSDVLAFLEWTNKVVYHNLTSRSTREYVQKFAELLYDKSHIYLIGRELQYATALEAALKIKAVSYIHAEAFAGGELKHGPLALIDEGTPCIVFVSANNKSKILSNAEEVKSRGGYIIGVASEREEIFDFWIKVPEADELNPIIQIISMQVLAYELAVLRGWARSRQTAKSGKERYCHLTNEP